MSVQLELITEKGAIVITEADLPLSDKGACHAENIS